MTHTSIYTPSLSSRTSHLSCAELAHIILTSFSKRCIQSRHLASVILQSVYEYTDAGSQALVNDDDLLTVSARSNLLMAVASRLEVDLKNQAWSGDALTDVKRMYHRIVFRLIQFLIETSGDDPLMAVNVVRSTFANTRRYLADSSTRTIERDIAITARKYGISYTQEATIESDEVSIPLGPQEPVVDNVRAVKVKTGMKSAFRLRIWGRKSGKERSDDESEWDDMSESDRRSTSEDEASDSGASMGGSDSEDEKGWDDEVGVAL